MPQPHGPQPGSSFSAASGSLPTGSCETRLNGLTVTARQVQHDAPVPPSDLDDGARGLAGDAAAFSGPLRPRRSDSGSAL
jgi:hypothetical protein